jgi:lysophospholipase II
MRSLFYTIFLVFMNIAKVFSMSTPFADKKAALIFLHGLGDSPAGWWSLESGLPAYQPQLKNIAYVFPPAPTIAVSINGGAKMPGWFDLFDWPIAVGSQDDPQGKFRAIRQIEDCIKDLEEQGIPRSKIVVAGFSQGGAIAMLLAYHSSEENPARPPLAGCASLSGWLTLPDDTFVNTVTPLFWAHGEYDEKVLFGQQSFGVKKLEEAGVVVNDYSYPIGHGSDPEEIEEFAKFLVRVLFPDTSDDKTEL